MSVLTFTHSRSRSGFALEDFDGSEDVRVRIACRPKPSGLYRVRPPISFKRRLNV